MGRQASDGGILTAVGRKLGNYGKELCPTLLIYTVEASRGDEGGALLSIDARGSFDEDEFVTVALATRNGQ